jgi:hypothetical protein
VPTQGPYPRGAEFDSRACHQLNRDRQGWRIRRPVPSEAIAAAQPCARRRNPHPFRVPERHTTMSATLEVPVKSEDLFQRCAELGEKYRELRSTPESRRGDTWEKDRRDAAQALLEANAEFDIAVKMERYAFERAAYEHLLANPPKPEVRGPQAAFADLGIDVRTPGQQFIEGRGAEGLRRMGEEDGVEVRNLLTITGGSSVPGSHVFAPIGQPLYVPAVNRQRRLFVRDLLSVQQTGLSSVPYIRELNAATNETGATSVAEASAKPEVTMQFEQADAPIRKIAAWLQATYEAISDSPTLAGYIDTRLAYMLMVREEAQVIGVGAGGGNAPNIKGILDFTDGIQTASGEFYDGVASAAGKIENVDGDPDGIVVNPLDYWAAVSDRHSTFYDGNANGGGTAGSAPFGSPPQTAWGLDVVRSRSVASGTAIVGSWRLGATLFEREGPTIRTTDSHASLFISNTWVILAEERVGLAVHRPDFFVKLTVTAPS